MTYEEFIESKEKVEIYEQLNKVKERLLDEFLHIKNGILEITTAYQHKISLGYSGDEFNEEIVAAISEVYKEKIRQIDIELEGI